MIDAIVKQLPNGVVVECSAVFECIKANPQPANSYISYNGVTCSSKNCILSVPEHGNRCMAHPKDTSTWLIDSDTSKIKQINI